MARFDQAESRRSSSLPAYKVNYDLVVLSLKLGPGCYAQAKPYALSDMFETQQCCACNSAPMSSARTDLLRKRYFSPRGAGTVVANSRVRTISAKTEPANGICLRTMLLKKCFSDLLFAAILLLACPAEAATAMVHTAD